MEWAEWRVGPCQRLDLPRLPPALASTRCLPACTMASATRIGRHLGHESSRAQPLPRHLKPPREGFPTDLPFVVSEVDEDVKVSQRAPW